MIVLKYLEWLVRINPVKITYFLLTLLCLYGANKFEPYKESIRIFKQFEWKGKSVYITETNDNLHIKEFDEPQEVKDGFVYYDNNPGEITSWVFFVIFLFLLIFSTFMGIDDDDLGWNLVKVKDETYFHLIKMDEEDGEFYYHLNGKLIRNRIIIFLNMILGIYQDITEKINTYFLYIKELNKKEEINY